MRYTVVTDNARRTLWGLQGNQWIMLSIFLDTIEMYNGETLRIQVDIAPGSYTVFHKCSAYALHRDSGGPPDKYRIEDLCAIFIKMGVVSEELIDKETGYRKLDIVLSEQHISYLVAPNK